MSDERLTALIPAHNDDYTLDLCLRSIAEHVDEVIVLDDCSTDHTPDVVCDAARRHRHVRLMRHEGEQQLGWVSARQRLLAATDAELLLWIDADDVLCEYNAPLLREIAGGREPIVRLQLCEMWGDFCHTTGRLRHYDRCHVFVNRRRVRDFCWSGGSMARPEAALAPARSPGPLFFHLKGVKPDRRLVERHFTRAWLRAGGPGRLEDFAGLARMDEAEIHRRALRILLHSRQDRLVPTYVAGALPAGAPPRPRVLIDAPERFRVVCRDGQPADRLDGGWAPPGPRGAGGA
jgi:glycosyltransferase involved in cell wall biosynthesis